MQKGTRTSGCTDNCHAEVVQLLPNHGADVKSRGANGDSVIRVALMGARHWRPVSTAVGCIRVALTLRHWRPSPMIKPRMSNVNLDILPETQDMMSFLDRRGRHQDSEKMIRLVRKCLSNARISERFPITYTHVFHDPSYVFKSFA